MFRTGAEVRRGVILDRDGTLIDVVRDSETGTITTAFHPSHLRILSGVVAGLSKLAKAGYVLTMATNQPGPAKGQITREAVARTNDALVAKLAAEGIVLAQVQVCMHHPEGGAGGDARLVGPCRCRKPEPGMLLDLLRDQFLDAGESWMVGDTTSDVEAGMRAGMKTGLVFDRRRCELCPLREGPSIVPTASGNNLEVLAARILA